MNKETVDPYATPLANLTANDHGIFKFKRFTAWAVFGLSIITLGIYPVYWFYTRAKIINSVKENTISPYLLNSLIAITVISFFFGFLGKNNELMVVSHGVSIVYMGVYLAVLFKIRSGLQDIMNQEDGNMYKLSRPMSFLFNSIYFQYKINEYIDNQSEKKP